MTEFKKGQRVWLVWPNNKMLPTVVAGKVVGTEEKTGKVIVSFSVLRVAGAVDADTMKKVTTPCANYFMPEEVFLDRVAAYDKALADVKRGIEARQNHSIKLLREQNALLRKRMVRP